MKALIADSIVLILSALIALACTAAIFGQPPVPPQAPPIVKNPSPFPRYTQQLLDTTKGPLVIFVGVSARKIAGAVVCERRA